ncbi:MAG: hypothetical protein M8353_05140, partial [ANME-2 cluster archaeon]|nr:hypothetical protein [ANME-2 cluster archaeon]
MKKPAIFGIFGGLALLFVYFAILAIANSPAHALEQFREMWYWILLLAAGFGVQAGLYTHIRIAHKRASTTSVAASGGMSTVSMAACCAHHLTDVLPLLGLSAAALFLVKYQTFFILAGVFSNFMGITVMLRVIQDSRLAGDDR